MSTITVTFTRIGRTHEVPPLYVDLNTDAPAAADRLAQAVHAYAGRFLMSADYAVDLDISTGRGVIGFGRYGEFTFTITDLLRTVLVRELRVGTPIEYRPAGQRPFVSPLRGRVRTALHRPGLAAVLDLEPLTDDELRMFSGSNFQQQLYINPNTTVIVLPLPGETDEPLFHPVISSPRVPVRTLPSGRHLAECQHCTWSKSSRSTTKSEIEPDVKYHREQHRQGLIEVVPRG